MIGNGKVASGRVWFVTGASGGFGYAVTEAAIERGYQVVATARDVEALKPLVDGRSEQTLALELDVTDAKAVHKAIEDGISRFGHLDIVFNNAGYGHVGAIEEVSDNELRQQLEVNLFGAINVTRAALPHMREQRSGHLLQMSSLNGIEGLAGGGYYAASKFAIEGLSESLADEVGHLGIKVTIIEPGPHRTRFLNPESPKWSPPIDDYADSVGQVREVLSQLDGNQPGDPVRAARAIVTVVEAAEPPRRLPLGKMAFENIRAKLESQLAELETWAHLGNSSDFPGD
jgi:NAD(P)-dependent dehydrogenase (short-subunit alcohol dehydrogenase family)